MAFIILAKLLPMGSPVCSTKLKSFLISLMRSSSPLSSPYNSPLHWQCEEYQKAYQSGHLNQVDGFNMCLLCVLLF